MLLTPNYQYYIILTQNLIMTMKFEKKHLGKWVATKGQKVIASEKSLKKVMSEVKKKDKSENIRYTLVPKGLLAG